MARRPRSPATFNDFGTLFPDDEACEAYLASWRWPDGPACGSCGSARVTRLHTRRLWQCRDCRHQTSVTAGTVMHRSKTPLRTWVYAFWQMGRRKTSVSALQFMKEVGIRSYKTAWALLHKVRRVLAESGDWSLKEGKVEVDEAMVGGRKGRFARRLGWGGAWLVAAVERIEVLTKNGKRYRRSGSARAEVVQATDAATLVQFVADHVEEGATVVTDGHSAYRHLDQVGMKHEAYVVGGSARLIDAVLPKVHLLFSNIKTWVNGTFHGVSGKYLELYVSEYLYRFNRRHHDEDIVGFISRRVMSSKWAPTASLLTLAEARG